MSTRPDLPDIVRRALQLSRTRGFVSSCRNETGYLLSTLAATRTGLLAETGTGCGVGSAWLRHGLRGDAHLLTIEHDASLAEAVRAIFTGDDAVTVLDGDWRLVSERAPFSLLFLDVREAKQAGPDAAVDLVEPGGLVVLDDFTPSDSWPPMFAGKVDQLRLDWLTDDRFATAEMMVTDDSSVLVAARR